MDIITGYRGEPHITAEQDRTQNRGIFGSDSYVLDVGMKMKAEISTNNEIKIRDGMLVHQGCCAAIAYNTYDTVEIANGSQGMNRIDLVVARYTRNSNTGVEAVEWRVIKGTPSASNPKAPSYTKGSIQAGGLVSEMPMYQVRIEGLNIADVEPMFEVLPSICGLMQNMVKFGSWESVPAAYTTDSDGFLRVSFSPSASSVTATVQATDATDNITLMSALCASGSVVTECVPVSAGHTYTCKSSSTSGTLSVHYMPIR